MSSALGESDRAAGYPAREEGGPPSGPSAPLAVSGRETPMDRRDFRKKLTTSLLFSLLEFIIFALSLLALGSPFWLDPPNPESRPQSVISNLGSPFYRTKHAGMWQTCFADLDESRLRPGAGSAIVLDRTLDSCTNKRDRLYRSVCGLDFRMPVRAAAALSVVTAAFTLGKLLWGALALGTPSTARRFKTYLTLALLNALIQLAAGLAVMGIWARIFRRLSHACSPPLNSSRVIWGWSFWLWVAMLILEILVNFFLFFAHWV